MCLYPRFIINRKYRANKKNGGNIPIMQDERVGKVPVGCGNCLECRKQKAQQWKIRLHEELKLQNELQLDNKCRFVTLTFSPEGLQEILDKYNTTECNAAATIAVRRFCELWRKYKKKAPKHWLITELGHEGTERIHLHGFIWAEDQEDIRKYWRYGNVWIGDYCTARTINYMVKYVTKIDKDHKNYKSVILCSPGIGGNFLKKYEIRTYQYRPNKTKEYYVLPNGGKVALPIYYRNNIWDDDERELLWLEKLDKKERWILGEKYSLRTEDERMIMLDVLHEMQKKNIRMGYGDDTEKWKKDTYSITIRMLNNTQKN